MCKVGRLVLLRHNNVAEEWCRLCAQALTPAAVSDERLIHSGQDLQVLANGEGKKVPPENRGDVAAHTIFDVRITDIDAPTYLNRDLATHEKEKDKYLEDYFNYLICWPLLDKCPKSFYLICWPLLDKCLKSFNVACRTSVLK